MFRLFIPILQGMEDFSHLFKGNSYFTVDLRNWNTLAKDLIDISNNIGDTLKALNCFELTTFQFVIAGFVGHLDNNLIDGFV